MDLPPMDFTMEFSATSPRADAILNGTFLQPSNQPTVMQEDTATTESHSGCPPLHSSTDIMESTLEEDKPDSLDTPAHDPLHLQQATIPELIQKLVDSFAYVTTPDVIPYELTPEEYKAKLKVWDENTSTSPTTNMHLGHLKAYWAEHTLPENSPEAEGIEEKRRQILEGHLVLLNYALKTGYSYIPWRRIVNTMLEKDPGIPKIHRLRVIHLYKADYNLILGVKWRQVLHHAVSKSLLNEGCYGSQPGKEASDALLIRELEYEISRLNRKASLHFDNDATSCCDRIPCFLANLASRKYGMNRKICLVQGKTMEEAKYFLKTKYGVSEEFIQHSNAHPIFGTGQGSGDSPTYWLFISSTLFDLYDTTAQGAHYQSKDRSVEVKVKAIEFVDDVRTSVNAFGNNRITLQQLMALATRDSQL